MLHYGTAATATGKMKQYSEVNATASASVATDMGWTVSAAISVDAGTGYDFADDDTFDGAKTNGRCFGQRKHRLRRWRQTDT